MSWKQRLVWLGLAVVAMAFVGVFKHLQISGLPLLILYVLGGISARETVRR